MTRRAWDGVRHRRDLAGRGGRITRQGDGVGVREPRDWLGHMSYGGRDGGGYARGSRGVSGLEHRKGRGVGGGSPGSVVTAGEKTVVLVVLVRVSDSVLVEVTEPREDQPFVTVVVDLHTVE